tara:strand:+ start:169 stop:384 length:216 start_codon:yes stop_codon:yes gene_type:complete
LTEEINFKNYASVFCSSEIEEQIPKVIRPAKIPINTKKAVQPITSGIHQIIMGSVYDSNGFTINQYATYPY